jgi:hypothetical protein
MLSMGESPSFPGQLRADLTASQWVTVTATGLALAAFLLVSLDRSPLPVSVSFGAEFLLSLSLLDMAFAYDDYWPVEYGPVYAVLWTLLFGAGTTVVFVGVYELGLSQVGDTTASIAAFLLAVGLQFGSAILYARTRR